MQIQKIGRELPMTITQQWLQGSAQVKKGNKQPKHNCKVSTAKISPRPFFISCWSGESGWSRVWSEFYKDYYYVNAEAHQVSWSLPTIGAAKWFQVWSSEEKAYCYVEFNSGETSWELPPGTILLYSYFQVFLNRSSLDQRLGLHLKSLVDGKKRHEGFLIVDMQDGMVTESNRIMQDRGRIHRHCVKPGDVIKSINNDDTAHGFTFLTSCLQIHLEICTGCPFS